MNNTSRSIRPIRFSRLEDGSEYNIFAEPSRNIRKSNDKTVYVKKCDAWSEEKGNPDKAIILMPEDLVVPLSRGARV